MTNATLKINVTITLDGQEPETMTETAAIEYFNLLFNGEQWIFDTRTLGDELLVYATRSNYHNDDDLYEDTPQSYYDWIMTTNDDGYLIVAELVD